MRQRLAIAAGVAFGAMCLLSFADSHASSGGLVKGPGLPVVEVLGCRVHGLGIVCSPGVALPKRLRKNKERYHKEEVEPSSQGESQKTPSSKGGAASKKGSSPEASGSQKDAAEQPATGDENAGAHACPPGNVVLEKPNAAGSYCEPVAGQSGGAAPGQSADTKPQMDKATTPAPAAATDSSLPPQTGAGETQASPAAKMKTETLTAPTGASTPPPSPGSSVESKGTTTPQTETTAATAGSQAAAPLSAATPTAKRICCKSEAFNKANGRPYSPDGLSMCDSTELDAKKLLKSFADAGNYGLSGPVTCESK